MPGSGYLGGMPSDAPDPFTPEPGAGSRAHGGPAHGGPGMGGPVNGGPVIGSPVIGSPAIGRHPIGRLDRWARRSLAGFAALGLALAVLLERFAPGHDPSLWVWDLRFAPSAVRTVLRLWAAVALGGIALGCWRQPVLRGIAAVPIALLTAVALRDALRFGDLWRAGHITRQPADFPTSLLPAGWPFSGWVVLAGLWLLASLGRTPTPRIQERVPQSNQSARKSRRGMIARSVRAVALALGVAAWAALFARGQMHAFGNTDYRGAPDPPADGIVIFGARAYANGAPSPALRNRIERALELYEQGFAQSLYLSGGPGDGEFHEVDVMAAVLTDHGVPPGVLIRDEGGWSTQLTVDHAAGHFGSDADLLAVSQAFHLPRIELTFARQGLDVRTVPATESRYLWVRLRNANRETLALGWYALRPLANWALGR